jgi:hypothetical protein
VLAASRGLVPFATYQDYYEHPSLIRHRPLPPGMPYIATVSQVGAAVVLASVI